MKIKIAHPTKAYIEFNNTKELQDVTKKLTYTNTSIQFQIMAHKKLNWLRRKDPVAFEERLNELNSQLKSCLLFKDEGGYWIRSGSIPYITENVVENTVGRPERVTLPWKEEPSFTPYLYQERSVNELLEIGHGNISLPTGAGKSYCLLSLARQIGNAVVITPSKSIFNELLNEFQKRLGKHVVGGYGDGKKDITKPITIAIGKSLTMVKENTPQYEFFSKKKAILIDESHSFAASQLENVCHGVLNDIKYRFFVSATQTRNDGTKTLLQSIIGKTVFNMSISEAISQGYLCPLNFHIVKTFSPSTLIIKDPIKAKRTHFLYNKNIAETAAKIVNASWRTNQESTLILVEELKQIQMLKDIIEVPFAYVHAGSKKDAAKFGLEKVKLQEQIDKFNNGEIKVLIGTSCIATGTNIFPTHNVINWMGGSSEIVTKQGPMGRSTRLLNLTPYVKLHKPKPFSRIFDFWIKDQFMLNKQLEKRIIWYEESDGYVKFC